jgi:hypothetical protein
MPLDFSITVKSRQDPRPSSSPATGLVLPASVASSSAGLLKLLKESGAPRSGGATAAGESSSAFRVVTPKGKFEGRPKQLKIIFNHRWSCNTTTTPRVNCAEKYSGKSTDFLLIDLCILSIFNDPVSTVDVM